MPYAARHSCQVNLLDAAREVCEGINSGLNGTPPDVAFLFVTRHLIGKLAPLGQHIRQSTGTKHLLACTAEFIAGGSEEIEDCPGISLWAGALPGAEITPFHVAFEKTADGLLCTGMPEELPAEDTRAVFMLADPFSTAIDVVIDRLEESFPGVPLLGGNASAGRGPNQNQLLLDAEMIDNGGVGLVVRHGPGIRSIVSQGCRPIGTPFVVTKSQKNVIFELGGKPPLAVFQQVFGDLSQHDRELVQKGLHLGIVLNEYQPQFQRGDFLITNVMDADRETGAVAIGNFVRTGQTVQFHVRDAATADEDLRHLLAADRELHSLPPQGALLFSCNGRGSRLFPEPNHDTEMIQGICGPLPLAGFFAAGEFGPVGRKNHIHGFTASIALFE